MRVRTLSLLSAILLCGVAAPAVADDPPRPSPAPPPPQVPGQPPPQVPGQPQMPKPPQVPKLDDPFLNGLVGSWDVAVTGFGSTGTGKSRVRKVCGDTTLLQETQVTMTGQTHYAVTTMRLDKTGPGLRVQRWDTTSGVDTTAFRGTVAADRADATSDTGMTWKVAKKGDAYEATVSRGATAVFTSTYTKSATDVEIEAPNAPKDGMAAAMVGTWDATGEWQAATEKVPVTGTSTFRWALGGGMLLHEYQRTSKLGTASSFGAYRWSSPTSLKVWWYDTQHLDPLPGEGPVDAAGWHGRGTMPDGGVVGLEWLRKGEGFEMRYVIMNQPAGFETYTKRR